MLNLHTDIWRGTAEQASVETDPEKLTALITQLCRELDEQHPPATPIPNGAFAA